MQKFMFIVKGVPAQELSPARMQARIQEYRAWAARLGERHREGKRLQAAGVKVTGRETVETDGPFLEAKEIIAGYVIVDAQDMEEAIRIAQSCPLLGHSELIVRPFLDQS